MVEGGDNFGQTKDISLFLQILTCLF